MRFNVELCFTDYKGKRGYVTVGREDTKSLAETHCRSIRHHVADHIDKIRVYDQVRMKELYVLLRSQNEPPNDWEEAPPNRTHLTRSKIGT